MIQVSVERGRKKVMILARTAAMRGKEGILRTF
jgi:hypothetical protein